MKVIYIAHHPNDGRTEAPDGQKHATSQEATARQKDTTIAARMFKFLPYPMLAFQCIGDKEVITAPNGRRVAFFCWSVCVAEPGARDYALKCASNLGKASLHR